MSEYLKSLCTAATLLSVSLFPFPARQGLRRAAGIVFALLFLLLLLPRDGSFSLDTLLVFSDPPEISVGEAYESVLASSVAEGIREDLASRFSLNKNAFAIETDLTLSAEALSGSYLRLYLCKENFFADATAILRYVENTYSVSCEVCYVRN